jgi:hypothetical protein
MSTQLRDLLDAALTEEPLAGPTLDDDVARGRQARRRRRRHRVSAIVAGVATSVAAALVVPVSPLSVTDSESADLVFASAGANPGLTASTDAVPHLLVDHPDWTIDQAAQILPNSGDLYLINAALGIGSTDLGVEISWGLLDDSESKIEDRRSDGLEGQAVTVLGQPAILFTYSETDFETFWRIGNHEYRVRAVDVSFADYQILLDSLREVDAETWYAAMPDDFERAYDNVEAIEKRAAELPVPDEFVDWYGERLSHVSPDDALGLDVGVAHWAACYWVRASFGDDATFEPSEEITENLTTIQHWAEGKDAVNDDAVWDHTEAVVNGSNAVNGEPINIGSAPTDLRCGGW